MYIYSVPYSYIKSVWWPEFSGFLSWGPCNTAYMYMYMYIVQYYSVTWSAHVHVHVHAYVRTYLKKILPEAYSIA